VVFGKSINAYFDCYDSIDVRVASYKQDDKWKAELFVLDTRRIQNEKERDQNNNTSNNLPTRTYHPETTLKLASHN